MDLTLVSATHGEIAPFIERLKSWDPIGPDVFTKGGDTIHILVTGIGQFRTSYALGAYLSRQPTDLCINAGIAGAFPGKARIGDVVQVRRERIIDLGAEDTDGSHLLLSDLGFGEDISSVHGLVNPSGTLPGLPVAQGITVQKSHGNEVSIARAIAHWDPDVETLEGGAFFYCNLKNRTPFHEIRAISNIVEPRNRDRWDIPLAIRNLSDVLFQLTDHLLASSR